MQSPGNLHQTLQVDHRVSILCSIIDRDEPMTLFWQKDGVLLLESKSEGIIINKVDHASILRMNNSEAHNVGRYSWHASNQAGSAVIFLFLQVKSICQALY